MASVSLAEPRRRQKWTLNPRGNLWANDESKFGQKLMEKMGWEKGRGLGANQDGMVDHITLKHKDNTKGVGFQGHDDTWLAHQDDFQNVLAALNVEHGEAGKNMDEAEKKATLSEISKKSKRRVHYQKFVKGKDSSNYSADDLGCILGTKSEKLKSKSEPSSPQVETEAEDETSEEKDKDKNFVQRGSYTDYFAAKMAALKAQGKFTDIPSWTEAKPNPRNLGLGADKVDTKVSEVKVIEPIKEQAVVEKKKKSKKKKKEDAQDEIVTEEPVLTVKKKSKKNRQEKLDFESIEDEVAEENEKFPKKKKKSKKNKRMEEVYESTETLEESEVTKKKKTKKSKKEKVMEEEKFVDEDSGCENEENKSKKTKKGKKEKVKEKKPTYSDEEKENVKKNKRKGDDEDVQVPKKKSKKKNCDPENVNTDTNTDCQIGFKGSNFLAIPGYGSSGNN